MAILNTTPTIKRMLELQALEFLNLNFIKDNEVDGWEERCTGTLESGAHIVGVPNSNCKIRVEFNGKVFVTQVYYDDIDGEKYVRKTAFRLSEVVKAKTI